MELVRELAEYEKAPEQVTVSEEHFEQSGFGDKPVWWAFVAETVHPEQVDGGGREFDRTKSDGRELDKKDGDGNRCGRIVGFAIWYIRYSTWKGTRMYLEDLYIEPAMRGRGIGAMLFERLIGEAQRRGLNGMVWQALEWNEPALNFYRKYNARLDDEWVNCSLDF